ncbi:MAG TPA: peptide chain release factor N(5)-glutamine methyltransferase [Dyella sp.]|uniref:peptide chain release factor N(5)-glutamine methyltransferase n=1 Tax=Dyella sp. TaxID=1869338 RepID=UPI002F958ED6
MIDVKQALAEASPRVERGEAELLLIHALGKPRSWLIAHDNDPLDPVVLRAYRAMIERRAIGEPVAYITGRRGFWSFDLEVSQATLIPRPETELLVELALERLPVDSASAVVDLGTGSGAIALALAHERRRAKVVATDRSVDALSVAEGNARRLGLRVEFAQGDWFDAVPGRHFSLVVSNPPYIEAADPHLERGDLRFEPPHALASGIDGLDAIRRIVDEAPRYLEEGGWLLVEHGWNQGDGVRSLFDARGYREVSTFRDLEGRDRVSCGRWHR